jgi:hypothetical protein
MIRFDPGPHTYANTETGQVYASVTTWLGETFFTPFDALANSERVAEREGRAAAEIRAEWEANGKAAADVGTAMGLELRDRLEGYWETGEESFLADFPDLIERLPPPIEEPLFEYIVWSDDLSLAGSIDLLANYGDRYVLVDFKTINDPISSADFNPYQRYMKPPLGFFNASKRNRYDLQAQLYRRLLGDVGAPVECAIYYVNVKYYKRKQLIATDRQRWIPCRDEDMAAIALEYRNQQLT